MKFRPRRNGVGGVQTCPPRDHSIQVGDPTTCQDCGAALEPMYGGTHMHLADLHCVDGVTYSSPSNGHSRVLICFSCLNRYREYVALEAVVL